MLTGYEMNSRLNDHFWLDRPHARFKLFLASNSGPEKTSVHFRYNTITKRKSKKLECTGPVVQS